MATIIKSNAPVKQITMKINNALPIAYNDFSVEILKLSMLDDD